MHLLTYSRKFQLIDDVKIRCPQEFGATLAKTRLDIMGTQATPLKKYVYKLFYNFW